MIRSFEDYVDKANQAQTKEELFTVYLQTLNNHGLDRALFALMTDHKDIRQNAGVGVIHNFPGDWMAHYFENGYDKIDPVISYGATQLSAYRWEDIPTRLTLTKKQQKCLHYGKEAGLNSGVATYLRGSRGQLAGVSLASSEKKDGFDGKIDLITAYSNHFYIQYQRIHKISDPEPCNIILSNKEREVLTWVATGKTDSDISDILSISEHTVDFHLRNIYRKLDANDRMLAVIKALSYGLINP